MDKAPAQSTAAARSSQTPAMSAQSMQQTLQTMCENPSMMEEMRKTLASMTPEQMQAAVRPCKHAVLAGCPTVHEATQSEGQHFPTMFMMLLLLSINKDRMHSHSHCRRR